MSRLHWAARRGILGDVEQAVADGEDLDERTAHHFTALHLAAQEGFDQVARCLLGAGADPELAHPNGRRALHFAASSGHLDVVKCLIEQGAEVDGGSNRGETPALEAATFNRREVAEYLFAHGANPEAAGRDGKTAREWLELGGIQAVVLPHFASSPEKLQFSVNAVRKLMTECPSPEEFVARRGRRMMLFSLGAHDLPDPEADRWAKTVQSLLSSKDGIDQCEDQYLTGEELVEAQRVRGRYQRAAERRLERDRLRAERSGG